MLALCPAPDNHAKAAALAAEMEPLSVAERLALMERAVPGRLVFTTSFGLEDQVLAHALAGVAPRAAWVTIDTGRLFPETLDVWAETEARFGRHIRGIVPEAAETEALVLRDGAYGFRESRAAREACCHVRKVEPLSRALKGAEGWITGLRAGQSGARSNTKFATWDTARTLFKFAPLADWSASQVQAYVWMNSLPYNALHDRGFPSIGCAPCTRAVRVGEDERSGRWWWEGGGKECGLHVQAA